jgi:pyruvate formate lyase activating enzyme
MVGGLENTCCRGCGKVLIRRYGYHVEEYALTAEGNCPACGAALPGRWAAKFEGQITSSPFLPRRSSRLVTILN